MVEVEAYIVRQPNIASAVKKSTPASRNIMETIWDQCTVLEDLKKERLLADKAAITECATGISYKKSRESTRSSPEQHSHWEDMDPSSRLEIFDLDETTTVNDVSDALKRETGVDRDRKFHIFGPNKRSQFKAVCELEDSHSQSLLSNMCIQVSWVNCRVRQKRVVTRCHKCLGYGHLKKDCTETDIRNNC